MISARFQSPPPPADSVFSWVGPAAGAGGGGGGGDKGDEEETLLLSCRFRRLLSRGLSQPFTDRGSILLSRPNEKPSRPPGELDLDLLKPLNPTKLAVELPPGVLKSIQSRFK
jgi:hypothetical protein